MTTIFRLDASFRSEGSTTRALADAVQAALLEELSDATLIRRDVGLSPLPSTLWAAGVVGGFTPEEHRSAEQAEAVATAASLADELVAADGYVFAVPLYNWGVSQHAKTWVDVVVTDRRFGPGATTIAGRPAVLVLARGGGYGPGTPREGWDHSTGWLLRILEDVWGLEVQVVETELTLAPVQPHMAELRPLAAEKLARAHAAADAAGAALGARLNTAAALAG